MLIETQEELLTLEAALNAEITQQFELLRIRRGEARIAERIAKADALLLRMYREHFPVAAVTHQKWITRRLEEARSFNR